MVGTYDIQLVALSIVVAVIASYVALDLAARVAASQGGKGARYWLYGGAISMGTGIWSMHFIGMLAFRLPIPMSYDIPVTLLSLLIAMIVSGFALHTVSRDILSMRRLLSAGLYMGIGIVAMHYTGMAAMQMAPPIRYDPLLFALSVLIAIVAAMAALWIAFQLRSETVLSAFWKKTGSALVMGAAISGMHYTGMAAAIFAPNSLCTVDPQKINNVWLAGTIGGFTFLFLITTLLISVFDARLADHSAKLAAIIKNANDAIISRAFDGTVLSWNAAAERLFGYSAAEAIGRPIGELIHLPEARARIMQNIEAVHRGEAVALYETRRRTKDGRVIDVLSSVSPIRNSTGEISGASVILHDISALKLAEKNLRLASQVIENSQEGVMITDASNHIISVNPAFAAITGYAPQEVIGKTPTILSSGMQSKEFYQAMWASIKATGHWKGEIWDRRKNGELYCEAMSVSTVKNPHGEILYHTAIFSDITERKQAAEQLNYLAQYDTLTGLPNRNLFRDRLTHAMARAKRNELMLALMFLDLDRFKEINDTLGHTAGDAVLQAVAKVMKESLRDVDTIARLGGDEFTLILEDIAHVDQVTALGEKILKIFTDPLIIEGREIYVTASIGITLYPFGVDDIDALLQTADIAMHHAKEEGRNTYEFYAPEMNAHAAANLDMENLLRHALERQEFTLHYQPKVAVKSGRITGVEALLRWNSKELGSISPAKFIPLAEKTGLIVPIGEWVLRTACAQNKAWQEQGLPPLLMSVNLSPRQFRQKNLLEMITAGLQDAGLKPCFLELEITESMIMLHPEKAIAILQELHQFGVQLSVDDFGTGYSSLAYLKRFPVQKLKIDQSFMQDLTVDRDDAGIVTAVVAMAKSLGLAVVAEGVETAEQLAFLAKLKCEEYQGYYFSRPVPASEFSRLFHAADDVVPKGANSTSAG